MNAIAIGRKFFLAKEGLTVIRQFRYFDRAWRPPIPQVNYLRMKRSNWDNKAADD